MEPRHPGTPAPRNRGTPEPENKLVPMTERIAWIGTGVMGASMCGHLLDAGHPVTVFSRTKAKAEPLVARGARWSATPREAVVGADVIVTMVGLPADVRAVYFGPDGVLAGARAGATTIDMTSTSPTLAKEIDQAARAKGVSSLDAPVSGGDVGARNATLSIMVGGDAQTFES